MPQLLLKLLPFVKSHWREIAIVVLTLTVFGKMRYDHKLLMQTYEQQKEALQEQIEGLQAIHAEELRKKEEALQSYREVVEELEEKYKEEKREHKESIKKEKERIKKQFSQNKEELANEITRLFDFEYVPV